MYHLLTLIFSLLPFSASALTITIKDTIDKTSNALGTAILGITFVFATVVFLWGVITFIAKSDNPEERKKAKTMMIWGIIGLAVIVTTWGLVKILVDFLGVGGVKTPQPMFPK